MRRPDVRLAVAINRSVRRDDEWFDEPDDLPRLERALNSIAEIDDAVTAAGMLASRVTSAQAFGEGNKRTALLLALWILDRNGEDGHRFVPPNDRQLAGLLVKAASGVNAEAKIVELFQSRR